jgi:signal transduction histidine kinase
MTVLEHERLQESLKQRNHYLTVAVTEARGAVHALREPTFETLVSAVSALAASVALIAEALQCDVLGEGWQSHLWRSPQQRHVPVTTATERTD